MNLTNDTNGTATLNLEMPLAAHGVPSGRAWLTVQYAADYTAVSTDTIETHLSKAAAAFTGVGQLRLAHVRQ